MTRPRTPPGQAARQQQRSDRATNDNPHEHQDFASRPVQRGTERNETQIEGGARRNDAGSIDDGTPHAAEHGDDRRPYKRAGR